MGFDDGRLLGPPDDYLRGTWENRDWRNVPGPIYGAETDNCWAGRSVAPDHIVYQDDFGSEVVFRQPQNASQVQSVLSAAWTDPFRGYACDGDNHWNLELIRTWWADRARLTEWIDKAHRTWSSSNNGAEREAAQGLRTYRHYLNTGLETYLQDYGFWLDNHRPALPQETLPDLGHHN
ncbi:ferredoxin [Nocardia sp. CA-128927]|uniref:ferredoxin n=1 Tax=Nocardia sp. CA-128927 TaxID=3239975 RepID=UPI003D998958